MAAHADIEGRAVAPGQTPGARARISSGFRALEVRNYRLYWIGQLISLTGSWMQTTAQAWLVLQLTNSPFELGLVTTLQFLPIMLLSLFGGVLIDRLSKFRLIFGTQALAMVQAFVFAALVATGHIQLWHVYILAALQGTVNAFDNPARQAFVPELVGREHLVNAVALNSMLFNASRIAGPALAGLIIAQWGIAPALFVNALSFVAVLIGFLMMDRKALRASPPRKPAPVLRQLWEGLRYVRNTPAVLVIMLVVGAIGTFGYNFSVVLPLLAGFVLKSSAAGFGVLSAFLGIGSLLAAITTAYAKQVTLRRVLLGAGAFSILLGLVALSTNYAVSAALLVALGFAGIMFTTSANTQLQLMVPDELRGRVISLYFVLFAGSTPIGGFLIGTLSSVIGVSATLLLCAALCLAGVVGVTIYRRRSVA